MIQRLFALILFCCCLTAPAFAATETSQPPSQQVTKPQKSIEAHYLDGTACLKQTDTACAQAELAGISPASPYAKLLEAQIAALLQDDDKVLRLLIPLQINDNLLPQAIASLHATLAQAYENQGNILRAMEQYGLLTSTDTDIAQQHIWRLLKERAREDLLELRGESQDTQTQGWIDLALAAGAGSPATAISQWKTLYPDHPATASLLEQLAQTTPAPASHDTLKGLVAVLLPLNHPAYTAASEALLAGLTAARDGSAAEIRVYASSGNKTEIVPLYQKAVTEGAQYVIGPIAREEVAALAAAEQKLVPTLALNNADQEPLPENFMTFGLPVETEAIQTARIARAQGMQSAMIVSADTPLARRMEQAFLKEWHAQDGTIAAQKNFAADTDLVTLKADLTTQSADMIFLAADAGQARRVRPYLNASIPTFAVSHIYDGIEQNPENTVLSAIHFVDMPWMINPGHTDFAPYREAAAKLAAGEAQRWFAIGVDAWNILASRAAEKSLLIPGLSGTLHMEGSAIVRELPMAQFRGNGLALESER